MGTGEADLEVGEGRDGGGEVAAALGVVRAKPPELPADTSDSSPDVGRLVKEVEGDIKDKGEADAEADDDADAPSIKILTSCTTVFSNSSISVDTTLGIAA